MRFAMPPRQFRLGGWSLGARGARCLSFGVLGGLCGVLGDPLAYLVGSWGSLGIIWEFCGVDGNCLEVPRGRWEVPATPQGALEIIEKLLLVIVFSLFSQTIAIITSFQLYQQDPN